MKSKRYGDIPKQYTKFETSPIIVLPVPYDETSTWGKGADKGPAAIIEASANMELYDIETDSEVYTKGIHTASAVTEKSSPEAMAKAVRTKVAAYLQKDKFVVMLGGEHSVSAGAIQAYSKKFHNLSVLQLDAHTDLRDTYDGSKYNHACVMARAKECCPIVQVGIRSSDSSEKKNMDVKRIFFAEQIYHTTQWMDKVISLLSEEVYITIDLDVFDPSIMPSTGTPEPGGMGWYEVLTLLKKVAKEKNIVGFDVVELSPSKENKAPDFLAAKLIYKLLNYKFNIQ